MYGENREKRLRGSSAPSRTARIGGTRVARIDGTKAASTVTTIPIRKATTTVRVAMTMLGRRQVEVEHAEEPVQPVGEADAEREADHRGDGSR